MDFSPYLQLVPSPVALVTGANKGIGFEIARELAEGGVLVWLAGRDEARVQNAAARLEKRGLKVKSVALDVTSPESAAAAVREVEAALGRLDILVNNAGISAESSRGKGEERRMTPPSELDLETLRRTYETNVYGPFIVPKLSCRCCGNRRLAASSMSPAASARSPSVRTRTPSWPRSMSWPIARPRARSMA